MNLNELPNGVKLGTADLDKIHGIWEKIKGFDKIFSDNTRWDEEWFFKRIYDPQTIFFEVDNGIMMLTDMEYGLCATGHFVFWDCKLSPRTQLIKECLLWCFLRYDLQRIDALVPEYARALRRFIEDKLEFQYEGRLRNRMWYMGNLCDIMIYSMLRGEAI